MSTEISPPNIAFPQSPQQEESSWEFIAFAWRRKWIVIFLLVLAIGLGVLYHMSASPVYESMAQVLIVKDSITLPIEGIELSSTYDSTHEMLISSPRVLKIAVDNNDLAKLPSLAGSTNRIATIMQHLEVQGVGGDTGDILELRYRTSNRHDGAKILTAVVLAYEGFLENTQRDESLQAIELINEAKEELDQQIAIDQADFQEFRNQAALLYSGESATNVHENRMAAIEGARSEVLLSLTKLRSELDALVQALERGGNREALKLLAGRLRNQAPSEITGPGGVKLATKESDSFENHLFPLLLQEEMLLAEYGEAHPEVRAVRKRIEITRQHLLGMQTPVEEETEQPLDLLDLYLASLNEQMTIYQQTFADLDSLFEKEREAARALANDQATFETMQSAIQRKEHLYSVVIKRLEELNLSTDTRGLELEEIHPPGPGDQVEPDLAKNLIISTLLGLMAGLGLAFAIDAADRRFTSAEEIRQDLGVPVVGHIPLIPFDRSSAAEEGNEDPISPVLRVYHHPRGRIAEAYRAVRTALYFSTRGGGSKIIQVTSPNPGDGKTTLCANLAVSMAQSDKKVLLLDCDFRRPRCHTYFGVDDSTGMTDVITGDVEISDAVLETGIDNLWLMPCGTRPDNPSELLTSRRFEELLHVLSQQYDMVLVDTPPVLIVTDPLNVAPRVDAVLVVMRLSKNARGIGRRAIDELDAVGANIAGLVVNGISGGAGRYGRYAKYGYGYGNGYRYASGYGYGYGQRYGGYRGYGDAESASDGNGKTDRRYYDDDDGSTLREKASAGKNGRNGQS